MNNDESILSICIPTYNRGNVLKKNILNLILLCKDYSIQICVSDNYSTDDTRTIMESFCKKYDFVNYYCQQENIGSDDNFEYVLKMAKTKYRWLMSDTTVIDDSDIQEILHDISIADYDAYIVGGTVSRNRYLPAEKKIYNESITLMNDVGWHLTWISCLIYNERLVNSFNFVRYKDSSFNQTALIFEPTANRECLICFNPHVLLKNSDPNKVSGWHYHVFDVFYRQWYLLIMSLPLYYPYEVKKKCIVDSISNPKALSIYYHAVRRSQCKWNYKDIHRNKFFIEQAKGEYILLLLLSIIPVKILKWIVVYLAKVYISLKKCDLYG